MNKQQLANKIWESANRMRSKIEANEYKDYILGFIFYKFLSDKEVKYLYSIGMTDEDIRALVQEENAEIRENIQKNVGYFIAYSDLLSTWIAMGKDFDVSNVRDALSAFSRLINPTHKKVFEGIFDTLQTGLSKLGDSSGSQTRAISDLIHLIKDIPMDGKQDYDVLGFIYEYLIGMFAANAGKKAGEFYTPHEVSLLMSEIIAHYLRDKTEISIYDPTSGSGSLLINIGRSVAKHIADPNRIKYFAQELKQNTYNLTRMNLVMRGISPDNIVTRNADTLETDWPWFDESDPVSTYEPLYVDAVVSNPPYSQNWEPDGKETNARFARFGLAPKTKADYAFLLHDLYHLKPDGIMNIVLPHGVLFRGGEEGNIRKNLIEYNHIDVIIGLPANIFFGTGIPTIIMVLRQKRENTDVLIVDASKGFEKVGKNNKLRASDIRRIADTVAARRSIDKFSRVVSKDEIRRNEYNLNIPRYVDSSEAAESWDIYASMFGGIPGREIDCLSAYWQAFPNLRNALFEETAPGYYALGAPDIKSAIEVHPAVLAFRTHYAKAFSGWRDYLRERLIDGMAALSISREEGVLSEDIFARLNDIPLVDPYEAYQLLDDEWTPISGDLEIIQTEGFDAVRKVDPNMVLKKKDGKDQEVQDGWRGHVLPFDLIQNALLKSETARLEEKKARLSEIETQFTELLDAMSEEEKEADTINENGDAFVAANVQKVAKGFLADQKKGVRFAEDSYEARIVQASELLSEEKTVKSAIKSGAEQLHMQTKQTIEALADEQARILLEIKWIQPLTERMSQLPDAIVKALTQALAALQAKYATTFSQLETEIAETEASLVSLLDGLVAGDADRKGLDAFRNLLGR